MDPLQEVEVGTLDLDRFDGVLDASHLAALHEGLRRGRELFAGRRVWHVNSTAQGGGVAEMLPPLLAYARGGGVDARWLVVRGDDTFFRVTKRVHNRLHGADGDGGPLGAAERDAYHRSLASAARALRERLGPADALVLHDPQTAGLIPVAREAGVPVVWRCHIGTDVDGEQVRQGQSFLLPDVQQADAIIFSRDTYIWHDVDRDKVRIVTPTIDAFSPKNQDLPAGAIAAILHAAGLREEAGDAAPAFQRLDGRRAEVARRAEVLEGGPLRAAGRYVLQVSRWDALKDPLGVIDGFAEHIAPSCDAHLVLAGPAVEAVSDDPEGKQVLDRARARFAELDGALQERVHLVLLPMDDLEENAAIVNALQREAAVVVQKSIAEGFGLTVSEAMWKARPVVASQVGGIQDQIEDGASGVLLADPRDLEAFGAAVRGLLQDEERSQALGTAARLRVRDRFLGTQSLLAYLALFDDLL